MECTEVIAITCYEMKHTSCFQVRKGHSEVIGGHDLVVEAGVDAPPWLGDGTVVPVVQQQRVQLTGERSKRPLCLFLGCGFSSHSCRAHSSVTGV